MKPSLPVKKSFLLVLLSSFLLAFSLRAADSILVNGNPILVSGTHGRFDFIEFDQLRGRLLAGHPGNSSLDVIDAATGKLIQAFPSGGAADAAVDTKAGRYIGSLSKEQQLVIIDATTLKITGAIPLPGPADLVAFDSKNGLAYAGHDDASEIWAVDLKAAKITASIPISEGPEGIVYDEARDRVYANVRGNDSVVVIDPSVNRVIATCSTAPAKNPHGLALDAAGHRLFAVGGNGKLVTIDLGTGKVTASADVSLRVDEIAYDPGLHRVYCASGTGVMSVVDASGSSLKTLGNVPTHKGAHSVTIDEKTHAVWIAYAEGEQAFVQAFSPVK